MWLLLLTLHPAAAAISIELHRAGESVTSDTAGTPEVLHRHAQATEGKPGVNIDDSAAAATVAAIATAAADE
jgi:hypothetical protein